jgi:hypothetical protein
MPLVDTERLILPEKIITSRIVSTLSSTSHSRRLPPDPWYIPAGRFIAQEWPKIPIAIALGALVVAAKRLIYNDTMFRQLVWERWRDSALRAHFAGFGYYRVELYTVAGALTVLVIALCSRPLFRVFRSWIEGVSSGLGLIWALSFFTIFPLKASERRQASSVLSRLVYCSHS